MQNFFRTHSYNWESPTVRSLDTRQGILENHAIRRRYPQPVCPFEKNLRIGLG